MHPLDLVPELQTSITDQQRAEWLASGPVDWANESFAIARMPDLGYCVMVGDTGANVIGAGARPRERARPGGGGPPMPRLPRPSAP